MEEEKPIKIDCKPEIDCTPICVSCRYDNSDETYYYFYIFFCLIIQYSLIITIVSISFATDFQEYFINLKGFVINTLLACILVYLGYAFREMIGGHFLISFMYIFVMVVYMFLISYLTDQSNIKVALIIVLSDFITMDLVIIIFQKVNQFFLYISPIITTIIEIILFQCLYIQDGSITWRLCLIEGSVLIYIALMLRIVFIYREDKSFSFGLLLYDIGLFVPAAIVLFIPLLITSPCLNVIFGL